MSAGLFDNFQLSRRSAGLLMLLVAVIWGLAFVFQAEGLEHVGAFTFVSLRFFIGAAALLPFALLERRKTPLRITKLEPKLRFYLLMMGLCLGAGALLQQAALLYTNIANAAFITTLYVPFVPLIAALFLRTFFRRAIWVAVAFCIIGTYLLAGFNPDLHAWRGDLLMLVCALIFALHILTIGAFIAQVNLPLQAGFVQLFITALIALPLALVFESTSIQALINALPALLYTGVLSSALAFTLQLTAQRFASPAAAAVLLSLESVFAALFGWALLRESLLMIDILGCLLIFTGVLIVELWPRKPDDEQPPKSEPAAQT